MRRPFDPRREASRVLNRCCEGNAPPTAWNLLQFQFALVVLMIKRSASLVRNEPKRLLRLRRI